MLTHPKDCLLLQFYFFSLLFPFFTPFFFNLTPLLFCSLHWTTNAPTNLFSKQFVCDALLVSLIVSVSNYKAPPTHFWKPIGPHFLWNFVTYEPEIRSRIRKTRYSPVTAFYSLIYWRLGCQVKHLFSTCHALQEDWVLRPS